MFDQSKGISFKWSPFVFVIVRQKLRFVGCNIDVCRAFRLAGFARETELQGFLNVFVFPAVAYHLALEHLKKHVSASPSAVFFVQRHHITRAHRAAITLPARAEPDAA